MSELSQLSPTLLWRFFDTICSIPHPSKHEAALCSWIRNWAAEQHISVDSDAVGNLILRKPATPGMEDRKGVILQAHLDMVPQANADSGHDFTRDPIRPRIDGEWVRATGTTLGADNGIGAAACLAASSTSDCMLNPCAPATCVPQRSVGTRMRVARLEPTAAAMFPVISPIMESLSTSAMGAIRISAFRAAQHTAFSPVAPR